MIRASLAGSGIWRIGLVLFVVVAGCGPGKYGSSVEVLIKGGVEDPDSAWNSDSYRLALGYPFVLQVDRACLVVAGSGDEPVSVTVLPPGFAVETYTSLLSQGVLKEACHCHGNPPHCHGDCGDPTSLARPVSGETRAVVDLTALDGHEILNRGATPGDYQLLLLTLGQAGTGDGGPQSCSEMTGRTFFLEGRLVNDQTADATPVSVDIGISTQVVEMLESSHAVPAETGEPARLEVVLYLDTVMRAVDWAALANDSADTIQVGGPMNGHPATVSSILEQLCSRESYRVEEI